MTLPPDPYDALNVARDATLPAIRTAHRKLVLVTHPDKCLDDSQRAKKADEFHRIQQAYELLSDDARRREYDEQSLAAKIRRERFGDRVPSAGGPRVEVRTAAPPSSRDFERGYFTDRKASRSYEDVDIEFFVSRNERTSTGRPTMYESRTASRTYDDRRAARAAEDRRDRDRIDRERIREIERVHLADKKKSRDRDRRKGRDDKYTSPRADYFDPVDEEYEPRRPKPYREESTRKSGDESSRRHGRSSDERLHRSPSPFSHGDELYYEQKRKMSVAYEHMEQTRSGASPTYTRPSMPQSHSSSAKYVYTVSPTSPAEPVARRSHARRSSDRERARPSRKDSGRETIEIVEPPMYESPRARVVPGMPTASSSPANIKIPPTPRMPTMERAATMQYTRDNEPEIRPLGRASTSPMADKTSRRRDGVSSKGASKLRTTIESETDSDSDYPPRTRTKDKRSPRNGSPAYVTVEPRVQRSRPRRPYVEVEEFDNRGRGSSSDSDSGSSRDPSPTYRYTPASSSRPSYGRASTSTKYAGGDSYSHAYPSEKSSRRPPLRQESSSSARVQSTLRHDSSPLGGGGGGSGRKGSYAQRGIDVQFSPRYRPEDVSFSEDLRREPESYVY